MTGWGTIAVVLLLMAASLLIAAQYRARHADKAAERRFFDLLERNAGADGLEHPWIHGVIGRMGRDRLTRWLPRFENAETQRLLKQAGWYSSAGRVLFHLSRVVLPALAVTVLLGVMAFGLQGPGLQQAAMLFIVAGLCFLLPKRILAYAARNRRNRLSREIPTAIHLLRMLFDAGLSIEHALRVVEQEGRLLTPELARELATVLREMDAGLEPAEALSEMAAPLEVSELSDTVAILKQVSRHGGNVRETLINFSRLMEERQLSALREYINVLSGKMSVVMMVFLFPALLIFLAGPGFMALAKGLMAVM